MRDRGWGGGCRKDMPVPGLLLLLLLLRGVDGGGGLALPGDHCPSVLQILESETWELEKVCFIAIIVGLPESKGLLCL